MTNLDTNRRIATLKGWTNINELGGSLIGTPPAHLPDSRGQRIVPDWTGDKAACFDLLEDINQKYFTSKELMESIVHDWLLEHKEEINDIT